jgi:hypothetical protein
MPELIQHIKDLSHKVSEDYLLFGKDMNDCLVELYQNGEIENEEVLKRICEHSNQNVYLGLFNDLSVNKANITFKIADFNTIIPIIRESEIAMNSLNTPPEDFRAKLSSAVTKNNELENADEDNAATEVPNMKKFAGLETIVYYRNAIKDFSDKIEMMKCAEEKVAEQSFEKMFHDARIIVAKGDSLGDLSKIAARSIKEKGGDFMKVAQAYDMICNTLEENNYNVNTEFTKISSLNINHKSEILQPVHLFSDAIMKIAAFNEMKTNLLSTLNVFDKEIKKATTNV